MGHTWDVVVRWEGVACRWYVTGLEFYVLLSFLGEEKDDVCMANDGMAESLLGSAVKDDSNDRHTGERSNGDGLVVGEWVMWQAGEEKEARRVLVWTT